MGDFLESFEKLSEIEGVSVATCVVWGSVVKMGEIGAPSSTLPGYRK
jgi:hypothetical protein